MPISDEGRKKHFYIFGPWDSETFQKSRRSQWCFCNLNFLQSSGANLNIIVFLIFHIILIKLGSFSFTITVFSFFIRLISCISFLLLFIVRFQMSPQTACPRGGIITLVAFVYFFPTVCWQMCFQIASPKECIITLIAFVRLFSTVHLEMSPQITSLGGCIITLVAFV